VCSITLPLQTKIGKILSSFLCLRKSTPSIQTAVRRADLLVVMITCCNNAGTCCYQLKQWEECYKFGQNALVLLDALYRKRASSKLLDLLRNDGFSDAKLFGIWRVKSLLLISSELLRRSLIEDAIKALKRASVIIATYKQMEAALVPLEKEVRNNYNRCRQQKRLDRQKEKSRAIAMFGVPDKDDILMKKNASHESPTPKMPNVLSAKACNKEGPVSTVRPKLDMNVSHLKEPENSDPRTDCDDESPFLTKHKELLICIFLGVIGSGVILQATKRRW